MTLVADVQKTGLDAFAEFCSTLRLEDGSRLELYSEQRLMLTDYFEGREESLILIPKKNGKTTLMAALALHHVLVTNDASVVIGAASRDQATIMYDQAVGLIERSDLDWAFKAQKGYRRIDARGDRGRIRVLAADENTADGVIPTLALVDELHRHKTDGLYGIFRDGLGPRGGQLITISTAGASLDSPLGQLRSKAYAAAPAERDGAYHCVRTEQFVLHEWALEPEDDVDDLELVASANPAPWQTAERLRVRHSSPSMTPWQWRRFACGIWTEGEEPWIRPEMWDKLRVDDLELDSYGRCWVAVDVGVKHDSTAIVTVSSDDVGGVTVRGCVVLKPPTDGELPLRKVEQAVRDACEGREVEAVLFDPWTFRRSAEILGEEGFPMVEFPQSPERMGNASENLYRLIEAGLLAHDGDPVLRAHVMGGVTKATERGWRLVKDPRLPRPIDALIALAMAALPASQTKPQELVFGWA